MRSVAGTRTLAHVGQPAHEPAEGEHPVSVKFRGLRNRFVRWWVLGAPHEQPTFTPAFENSMIFAGANRVSAAFQLRFSCVSATFQLTRQEGPNPQINDLIMYFFCGPQTHPPSYF